MAQQVKNLALSLQGLSHWPGNFCMLQAWPKKKKKSPLTVMTEISKRRDNSYRSSTDLLNTVP